MQKRTITQIKKALKELSEKGWIKSNRLHNTGIGKTDLFLFLLTAKKKKGTNTFTIQRRGC